MRAGLPHMVVTLTWTVYSTAAMVGDRSASAMRGDYGRADWERLAVTTPGTPFPLMWI